MEDWQLEEWHNRMEQDYYDDLEANYYTANVDDETEINLISGKSLYAHFNVVITDYNNYSDWQFDFDEIDVVDDKDKEVYNGKKDGISLLTKDEEDEMYFNIEKYLYEKDRLKEIVWS